MAERQPKELDDLRAIENAGPKRKAETIQEAEEENQVKKAKKQKRRGERCCREEEK